MIFILIGEKANWTMPERNGINRRRLLAQSGIAASAGALTLTGQALADAGAGSDGGETIRPGVTPEVRSLDDIALESAFHSAWDVAAFTSVNLGRGLQLYFTKGVSSRNDRPDEITRLTDAREGVHAPSWENKTDLKYSMDGATFSEQVLDLKKSSITSQRSREVISQEPLPLFENRGVVSTLSKVVYCRDFPGIGGWCIRLHHKDSGHSPRCTNNPTPPSMVHSHFSIFPMSDAKGGINLWGGYDGNCFYAGEEHYSGYCVRVCGNGGLPGLGVISDAFEDVINTAAEHADIVIPAAVVVALAYYLAVSTLAPPPGVPLV